jgi:hypothetical protein
MSFLTIVLHSDYKNHNFPHSKTLHFTFAEIENLSGLSSVDTLYQMTILQIY